MSGKLTDMQSIAYLYNLCLHLYINLQTIVKIINSTFSANKKTCRWPRIVKTVLRSTRSKSIKSLPARALPDADSGAPPQEILLLLTSPPFAPGFHVKHNYRARRAFRITTTSMTSCRSAPTAGWIKPRAATTINAKLRPNPTKMLCFAIRDIR
jgi:hypothetical protein